MSLHHNTLNINYFTPVNPFRYSILDIIDGWMDRNDCEKLKNCCFSQTAAILSSIFISQNISVYMEMFQTPADQRESHVFSTAGRSKGLPANSVPAGPQRGQRSPACAHVSCMCALVFLFMHMQVHGSLCNDNESAGVRSQLKSNSV